MFNESSLGPPRLVQTGPRLRHCHASLVNSFLVARKGKSKVLQGMKPMLLFPTLNLQVHDLGASCRDTCWPAPVRPTTLPRSPQGCQLTVALTQF